MEQKDKCQQNQGDGEGGECEVDNPFLYFHHCNKELRARDIIFTFLIPFFFAFPVAWAILWDMWIPLLKHFYNEEENIALVLGVIK